MINAKKDNMNVSSVLGRGVLMLIKDSQVLDTEGTALMGFSTKEGHDELLISLQFNAISILTEVNSDHIVLFKKIIEQWERSFKQ